MKRQANIVSSILSDVKELERAYDLAGNSQGSAMKEFSKYQESIQYSLDRFKESLNGFYLALTDDGSISSFLQGITGIVEGVTKVSNTFGTLPTILATVTTAFILFNQTAKENMQLFINGIPSLNKFNVSMSNMGNRLSANIATLKTDIALRKEFIIYSQQQGLATTGLNVQLGIQQAKLAATTAGMIATKFATIALEAAMSMGLSIAITAVITGLTKMIGHMVNAKEELKQFNEEAQTVMTDNAKVAADSQKLYDEMKNLEKAEAGATTEAEKAKIKKELLDVQRQLAETLPNSATGFDEEGKAISANSELIKEQIALKKEEAAIKAMEFVEKNKDLNKMDIEIQRKKDLMDKMNLAKSKGSSYYSEDLVSTDKYTGKETVTKAQIKFDATDMAKANKELQDMTVKINQAKLAIDTLRRSGKSNSEIEALGLNIKLVDELTESLKANTSAKEENKNKSSEQQGLTLEDSTKAYAKSIDETQKLYDNLEEINKEQAMTPQLIAKIGSQYPELGAKITDISAVQAHLNELISEQEVIQGEAYQNMIGMDNEWYATKLQNGNEIQEAFNQFASDFIDVNGEAYTFDANNFDNLNAAKVGMIGQLARPMAQLIANLVGGNADGYEVDLRNFTDLNEAKLYILKQMQDEINKIQGRINDLNNPNFIGPHQPLQDLQNQLANAQKQTEQVKTSFDKLGTSFNDFTPNYGASDYKGSDSSSDKDKGSKDKEKEIADIDSLHERYYDLENAIKDVNDALEMNKIMMDRANGQDKIKYIEKEIELYNQLKEKKNQIIELSKEEAKQIGETLAKENYKFDEAGNISNRNEILDLRVAKANSLSGQDKEDYIKYIKWQEELIKNYTELTQNAIPDYMKELEELNNKIKDSYKDQANMIADYEKEISDLIKNEAQKRLDAKKKALEDEKNLYNKQYEEEKKKDEMNDERKKLAQIEADLDKFRFDTSQKGQLMYKQLLAEYEAQSKIINDKIKDQNHQNINDRFEEEQKLLDKELEDTLNPEKLNQMVSDAMKNGIVNIMGDMVNINNAMADSIKENNVGLVNTNIQMSEWVNRYKEVLELSKDVNKIMSGAGLVPGNIDNGNYTGTMQKQSSGSVINIDNKLTLNGGNYDVAQIQAMMDKQKNEIYNQIGKALGK